MSSAVGLSGSTLTSKFVRRVLLQFHLINNCLQAAFRTYDHVVMETFFDLAFFFFLGVLEAGRLRCQKLAIAEIIDYPHFVRQKKTPFHQ